MHRKLVAPFVASLMFLAAVLLPCRMAAQQHYYDVCQHTSLFGENLKPSTIVTADFDKPWKRAFPLLLLDLKTGSLWWAKHSADALQPLAYQGFAPQVATTDNVIVMICNAHQGDGSSINTTSVVVNVPDSEAAEANVVGVTRSPTQPYIDRIFLLSAANGSDITRVDFVGPTVPKGLVAADAQKKQYEYQLAQDAVNLAKDQAALVTDAKDAGKVSVDKASILADQAKHDVDASAAQTPDRITDTLATVLIERHHVIHFSAGGGLLLTEGNSPNYSALTVPTNVSTTTTASSTTTTGGVVSGTTTTMSQTFATSTASFAYSAPTSKPMINAIAGLTWYPFGHDMFPVSKHAGGALTYSSYSLRQSFGIFFATSVSSLGNFTAAPALELRPGIQVFAGPSWYSKQYLPTNVVACTGYGTSPQYQGAPTTTSTSTTTSTGPPATSTTTVTTVTTTATNGCANGNQATALSGSTIPTQTKYVPAFAFGVVFNTNLLKAFSGLK